MRRPLVVMVTAAGVAAAAILGVACRQYLPSNRYLQKRSSSMRQSTADARRKFDHRAHAQTFAARNIVCLDCHRFDVVIESTDDALARALSMHALYPGSAACHYCHRAPDTMMATAPASCLTCHENLAPLKPPDHDVGWLKVHEAMARAQPTRCEKCHRQADCIECHQARDTIQTRMHSRNFRFFHSVQARANPMQCGSCHLEGFCLRCHQEGKVE